MLNSKGFTLIELMVTLVVLAILASIAVPSFQNTIQSSRTLSISNNLTTAMQFARSEAIKRGVRVDICRRNGNVCANSTAWQDGWLVKINGGAVLRVWDATGGNDLIVGPNETLTFRPNGMLTATANKTFAVQFSSCTNKTKYTLTVSPTGRVINQKGTCT